MPTAVSPTFGARLAASVARLLARSANRVHGADAVWASEAPNKKASRAGPLIAFESLRRPIWTPRDYAAFANEGFMQNAIVYRCVAMIAECVASVPLLLYDGDQEIEDHPLLSLVRRPNGHETYSDFMQRLVGFLLVSGNAYVEAVAIDHADRIHGAGAMSAPEAPSIRELHVLRPDRMQVIPGPDGWPEAFEYTVAGRTVRISGDVVEGVRSVLHLKLFHPTNDHYGLSPLEAAASAIDLHNTAARWNKSLLDNSARPSGAIVYTARDGNLTSEQIERLKSELETGFQGSSNAGRPLLLEGGLDWKAMSLSPKDMDFLEARHAAAREIALALGVPPMLLGIPGDNTYSNLAEAQRTFWRSTVLPLVERIANGLSTWLSPGYAPDAQWASKGAIKPDAQWASKGAIKPDAQWASEGATKSDARWASEGTTKPDAQWASEGATKPDAQWASKGATKRNLEFRPDLDNLPALANEREALWASLEKTSFLTADEKRALAGFSPAALGADASVAKRGAATTWAS